MAKTIALKSLPQGVSKIPTNLPDVFTLEAPPADLNLLEADDQTLIRYGLPLKPRGRSAPRAMRTWERLLGRGFVRVQPQLRERPERKVNPGQGAAGPTTTSNVWSGGVLQQSTDPFNYIFGQWVVPTVLPLTDTGDGDWWSVTWVGLDGWDGSDVLQAGTAQHVSRSGKTVKTEYFAWYEWYPNSWIEFSKFTVEPGDTVAVTVSFDGVDGAGLHWGSTTISNVTRGKSTSVRFNPPAGTTFLGATAEWIMERPSFGTPAVPATLPQYGEVVFTDGLVCTAKSTLDASAAFPVNMDPGGALMSVGALSQDWKCTGAKIAE